MINDARETAAMNLHMHDSGSAYCERLAEQIIEQFKDAPKTTGIEQRILTRWNDKIGEPITPEPIDWAKRRAEHLPSPLASPPGLSRLQRERWEKKMRKGTLRAP